MDSMIFFSLSDIFSLLSLILYCQFILFLL
nr:MAG TPA: hypothetical protein [Caudoviricetes sp.]